MSLKIGDKAPVIKLYNTEKKEVNSEDFKGKNLVVLFFPLAFTGTCTAELCNIRDNFAVYNGLNAEVLGISVDSVFSLKKFKEEQKLNFDLLSDFNKTASAAYGSLYEEFILGMKGVSKRSAFVIDKQGVLQYIEVLESAGEQPNYQAIQNCLKAIG